VVTFFAQPYLAYIVNKSSQDFLKPIEIKELLSEKDYRTMLTGRIGIWQDIWNKFNSGDFGQRLFGTGLNSNAHSSYFFLLLQIGWFGLIFYVVFHSALFLSLWNKKIQNIQKTTALLALISLLLIGISLTTVMYTSFQWLIYLLIGGVLNLKNTESKYATKFGKT
jgi:O-antigen ligase